MLDVFLEEPLGGFPLSWSLESTDSAESWAQVLRNPFDDSAFSSSITSFEYNGDLGPSLLGPLRHVVQLDLQVDQLLLVMFVLDLALTKHSCAFLGGDKSELRHLWRKLRRDRGELP